MALIATSTDEPGVVRIFFDMQAAASSPQDVRQIEAAVERAFAPPPVREERGGALPLRRLEQFDHVA
jgi:hypothetical protein